MMTRPATPARVSRLALLPAVALVALLGACAAPAPVEYVAEPSETATTGGSLPGLTNGICPDQAFFIQESASANFSLGSEFYRNGTNADEENENAREDGLCSAYPYLRWLVENEPLYTGGDPDDRNFLRLANVYEYFAERSADDDARRRAYLDSALMMRADGVAALDGAGVEYDSYARDLREGFFYFAYADAYGDEGADKQFRAFDRAYRAQPDSLPDWYLQQLLTASAVVYDDNMERGTYMQAVAPQIDDAASRQYWAALADFLTKPPDGPAPPQDEFGYVTRLLAELDAGTLAAGRDRDALFYYVTRRPELVTEAGGDPDAALNTLLPFYIDQIDNPQTLFALFAREWRAGDRSQADAYFSQAISKATSNSQRADFYYFRAARGYGSEASLLQQALQYQPAHGPSLFKLASNRAATLGRPADVEPRGAYWCLADDFNRVAATGDPRVASQAQETARRYNRAAPTPEEYFFLGWRRGETRSFRSGGVSCRTTVR